MPHDLTQSERLRDSMLGNLLAALHHYREGRQDALFLCLGYADQKRGEWEAAALAERREKA